MRARLKQRQWKPVNETITFRRDDVLLSAFDKGQIELTIYSDGGTKIVERTADGSVHTGYDFEWEKEIY